MSSQDKFVPRESYCGVCRKAGEGGGGGRELVSVAIEPANICIFSCESSFIYV